MSHPQYHRHSGQPEPSPSRPAVTILAFVALLGAGGAAAYVVLGRGGGGGPDAALDAFLGDWSAGHDRAAAGRTDAPAAATVGLTGNRQGLDGARVSAQRIALDESSGGLRARARVTVTWQVPRIGSWSYQTRVALAKQGGKWMVHWAPTVVHPALGADTRLGTVRQEPRRGDILDRNGQPLVTARPVVRVGAIAGKVKDPKATAAGLARVLGVKAKSLERQLRSGGREQFVEAIVLRKRDYARLASELKAVPDVTTVDGQRQLAPTRDFGRAVLGTVAPATAEQLTKLGPGYGQSDMVGQWGLEARFEPRLAGKPERRIVIRAGGVPIDVLLRRRGKPGRSLRTTLDRDTQAAAEMALAGVKGKAALVAVQPSTGNLLAVANRPSASSYDRALEGRYPPGSTFKVVSTAALLRAGLSTSETVGCPKRITVDGRPFKNFEGAARGAVPFSEDFAQSCNTAFVSLAGRVKPSQLSATARDFGLGRKLRLALRAASASVPPPHGLTERGAAMIGQAKILASPLAMAGVAATVADGRWRAPRIVTSDAQTEGQPLGVGELSTLRTLMRSVVTSGTGTALAAVPGAPAGKSGTAEFGSGSPPQTHAWFIAFRGDLAVAVLVERGSSGGRVAAPIAARFLTQPGASAVPTSPAR